MRDDDVFAARELAGEAFPGVAAHYYFVAHSGVFEIFHIFFDMEYQIAFGPEFAIFTDGCYDTKHITP